MFGIMPRIHPDMSCVVKSPFCDFLDGTEDLEDDADGMRRRLPDGTSSEELRNVFEKYTFPQLLQSPDEIPAAASGAPRWPDWGEYKKRYDAFIKDLPAAGSGIPRVPDMDEYRKRYERFLEKLPSFEAGNKQLPTANDIFLPENMREFPEEEVYEHMVEAYPLCHGSVL